MARGLDGFYEIKRQMYAYSFMHHEYYRTFNTKISFARLNRKYSNSPGNDTMWKLIFGDSVNYNSLNRFLLTEWRFSTVDGDRSDFTKILVSDRLNRPPFWFHLFPIGCGRSLVAPKLLTKHPLKKLFPLLNIWRLDIHHSMER